MIKLPPETEMDLSFWLILGVYHNARLPERPLLTNSYY